MHKNITSGVYNKNTFSYFNITRHHRPYRATESVVRRDFTRRRVPLFNNLFHAYGAARRDSHNSVP